jgi:ferredoxin
MEQSEIGNISTMVKDCLRCGKCKPVCSTHVPRANLLYSPRNKILATSLLIEAFLYEEQTRRGVSLRHFDEFNDVADHCTICHKCVTPARSISISAMSRSACAICCANRARRSSCRPKRRRWPS